MFPFDCPTVTNEMGLYYILSSKHLPTGKTYDLMHQHAYEPHRTSGEHVTHRTPGTNRTKSV
jgi:hypothetical protein